MWSGLFPRRHYFCEPDLIEQFFESRIVADTFPKFMVEEPSQVKLAHPTVPFLADSQGLVEQAQSCVCVPQFQLINSLPVILKAWILLAPRPPFFPVATRPSLFNGS